MNDDFHQAVWTLIKEAKTTEAQLQSSGNVQAAERLRDAIKGVIAAEIVMVKTTVEKFRDSTTKIAAIKATHVLEINTLKESLDHSITVLTQAQAQLSGIKP